MRRIFLFALSFCLLFAIVLVPTIRADELEDIQKQIGDLSKQLEASQKATTPLESEVKSMEGQIASLSGRLDKLERDLKSSEEDLEERKLVLASTVRNFYIRSFVDIPLLTFFASNDASETLKLIAFQQTSSKDDKTTIKEIGEQVVKLAEDKKKVAGARASLSKGAQFLKGEIASAKSFQSQLSGQISALSARQTEIINARSGTFTFSLGSGELADELLSSIKGFKESAPGGYFAVFSFGAYTHRNGMSQYGARGRAESGQSVEQILQAYFPNTTLKKDYPAMGSITVDGFGSMPFEDQYLQGIYEVPGSWHVNVLKAQAIAARTYAIKRTNNGQSSICSTEACQVFKNSKKGGAWEQAVNETKGWVLVDGGGNPVSTQYASTHGGFTNTAGWDTTDGSGGSNFIDKSYDKQGNSPWLYKSWWRQGYSNQGNTCGRANPWLSPVEMADIVNAAIALKTEGIDTGRITPVTTACWGGNPYSMDELRNLVSGNGGISNATSVSVSQGNGTTGNVTVNGLSLSGTDFKRAFNLRAPGYLAIPQSGFAFFNIEKK